MQLRFKHICQIRGFVCDAIHAPNLVGLLGALVLSQLPLAEDETNKKGYLIKSTRDVMSVLPFGQSAQSFWKYAGFCCLMLHFPVVLRLPLLNLWMYVTSLKERGR